MGVRVSPIVGGACPGGRRPRLAAPNIVPSQPVGVAVGVAVGRAHGTDVPPGCSPEPALVWETANLPEGGICPFYLRPVLHWSSQSQCVTQTRVPLPGPGQVPPCTRSHVAVPPTGGPLPV